MANLTINFDQKLNTSLQKGDIIYYVKNSKVQELGICQSVASDRYSFIVDVSSTTPRPSFGDYFMFAKNNVINSNGLIGYHANVTMENDSTEFVELYAVNSEIMLSSN
tara:strand:+ start:1397 stop:1720 length:324 start_codon:yes stop_codon:yes gene_type:complete